MGIARSKPGQEHGHVLEGGEQPPGRETAARPCAVGTGCSAIDGHPRRRHGLRRMLQRARLAGDNMQIPARGLRAPARRDGVVCSQKAQHAFTVTRRSKRAKIRRITAWTCYRDISTTSPEGRRHVTGTAAARPAPTAGPWQPPAPHRGFDPGELRLADRALQTQQQAVVRLCSPGS